METAIHFESSALQAFSKLKQTPQVKQELAGAELIKRLSEYEEWQELQRVIDSYIEHLENMQGMIDPSDSVEAVGFRYLAAQTAVTYLKAVRDYPKGIARAAVSKADHAKRK